MLSIDYGFGTSVRRSGHAACWCAALGGVVQFGGWPPSEQLGEVVRHEGSSCPLYLLPLATVARHVHRADQRRGVDVLDRALAPHRQRRLRRLCGVAAGEPVSAQHSSHRSRRPSRVGSSAGGGGSHTPGRAASSARRDDDDDGDGGGTVELASAACSQVSASSSCSSSRRRSAVSATTEEASNRGFEYDEGYVSERASQDGGVGGDNGGAASSSDTSDASSTSSASLTAAPAPQQRPHGDAVVAPPITVELLRQAALETSEPMPYRAEAASVDHTSVSPSTRTGYAASALRDLATNRGGAGHGMDREAPPVRADTREVRGKHTVRPLRWQAIRPPVAPRSRHGHHLVSCGDRLYVIGGSYWAHGHALASTDMMYDVRRQVWHQISSLFPQRFCAALATSNAAPTTPWSVQSPSSATAAPTTGDAPHPTGDTAGAASMAEEQQVLYYFGGLNYSHALTNSLHRLWLPQEVLEELPQYGAAPRAQFKGLLVCDVQRECTPEERRRGERALGRLFYMDGFQDGRPMAPCLRVYNLATGVWVRVCAAPDLVRSQVSMLQYEPADGHGKGATRLRRFEVMGGMPARRGRQRRSRMCHSFDAQQLHFDYSHALPVPGLTAHCVVLLPPPPVLDPSAAELARVDASAPVGGDSAAKACRAALRTLRARCGSWSLCCGGNEDWDDAEQNSLGVPVGWLYLLSPRPIPLREVARVQMERLHIPAKVLLLEKDELLDELF